MKKLMSFLALVIVAIPCHSEILQRGKVQLICHRTANRDVPENTLESLEYAARMGCNVIEVDIRMTLDGQLVLNHDGYLERLTEGMGDLQTATLEELKLYDYGGWMADRFSPMRIPLLTDALRIAKQQGIGLALDIKEKGEGAAIFGALQREGMLERVLFNGEDGNAEELRAIYPEGYPNHEAWLGPLPTSAEVEALHAKGKFVVANFSENSHQMDLVAMRTAVAAGVDAINVDYPRLGADAIGKPVEEKVAALAASTSSGTAGQRVAAILELSRYTGFPTQPLFIHLLRDPDPLVSRTAAVALVKERPAPSPAIFTDALTSSEITARDNAAWALGMLHAPVAATLLPLLQHKNPEELKEVLLALSLCPGQVSAAPLIPFLHHEVPTVRAAAALALARHQPDVAAIEVPRLLHQEEQRSATSYATYVKRGKPKLTQAEIDPIVEDFREHMKLIHALELLPEEQALPRLVTEATRYAEDSSHVTSVLAGYGLWDRIATDPSSTMAALESSSFEVADRAEWTLVKAGPAVLPMVRNAVRTASPTALPRLIRVLAWQGDIAAVPLLKELVHSDQQELIEWALNKIELLQVASEVRP